MVVLEAIELRHPFDRSHQVIDWRQTNGTMGPDITTSHRASSRRLSQRQSIADYDGPNYEVIDVNNLESGFKSYNCSDGSGGGSSSRSADKARMDFPVPFPRTFASPELYSNNDSDDGRGGGGRVKEEDEVRNKWMIDLQKLREMSWSVSSIGSVFTVISTLIFFSDFLSDFLLSAFLIFNEKNKNPFSNLWIISTLLLTIIPALVVNFLSLTWYLKDTRRRGNSKSVFFISAHFLLLGPLLRNLNFVRKCIVCNRIVAQLQKSVDDVRDNCTRKTAETRKGIQSVSGMRRFHMDRITSCQVSQLEVDFELIDRVVSLMDEERNTSAIALLKTLLESGPQLILQISLRVSPEFNWSPVTDAIQVSVIVTSIVQLSWSLSVHQRSLSRSYNGDRQVITKTASLVQFVSKLLDISSRAVAIAFFTAHFGYWLIPVAVGHWGFMTVWIMHQETSFCTTDKGRSRPCLEYLLNMITGAICLISFVPVNDRNLKRNTVIYFSLIFIQNVTFSSIWYFKSQFKWFETAAIGYIFGALSLSLISLIILFHFFNFDHQHNNFSQGNRRIIRS